MADGELRLLHQDGQLLIVHKPAGWTIYSEDGVPKDQHLRPICQELFGQRLFPVHRLDRATCGIVVFATDGRWAREMQEQFAGRKIEKTYLALVDGRVQRTHKIDLKLKEKGKTEQSALTILTPKKNGKLHTLDVTLVELSPKTGRFHQLRKHCKLIDHPIVGDKLYGKHKPELRDQQFSRLMLSAIGLKFLHPRNHKELRIKDSPDFSFTEILKKAGIRL